MFWFAGEKVYDKSWPEVITAGTAAWRLRDMHYTTLSIVHGFLEHSPPAKAHENETISRWMRTPLDVTRLMMDRLPIAPAYSMAAHTGYDATRSRAPNGPPKARHEAGYRSPICLNRRRNTNFARETRAYSMPCGANRFEPMGMTSELLGEVLPIPPRDPSPMWDVKGSS
jgi:hypothetical protein